MRYLWLALLVVVSLVVPVSASSVAVADVADEIGVVASYVVDHDGEERLEDNASRFVCTVQRGDHGGNGQHFVFCESVYADLSLHDWLVLTHGEEVYRFSQNGNSVGFSVDDGTYTISMSHDGWTSGLIVVFPAYHRVFVPYISR